MRHHRADRWHVDQHRSVFAEVKLRCDDAAKAQDIFSSRASCSGRDIFGPDRDRHGLTYAARNARRGLNERLVADLDPNDIAVDALNYAVDEIAFPQKAGNET